MKKAVVLLSGGLDSATTLYYAKSKGYCVYALTFDYGQRHKKEVKLAKKIAKHAKCSHQFVRMTFPWKGSSLLDKNKAIPNPKNIKAIARSGIPSTYVPARNIVFLSLAASMAESIGAKKIFIGANARDYSGYPDCRPSFIKAFQQVLRKGTKTGVKGKTISVEVPLIKKTKAEIIKLGLNLNVPFHLTWSCYSGGKRPCQKCDSCLLRAKGFDRLKIKDPIK